MDQEQLEVNLNGILYIMYILSTICKIFINTNLTTKQTSCIYSKYISQKNGKMSKLLPERQDYPLEDLIWQTYKQISSTQFKIYILESWIMIILIHFIMSGFIQEGTGVGQNINHAILLMVFHNQDKTW